MGDTVKEVVKSNDIELIKRIRTTFKAKLTRAANSLSEELKKNEDGIFLFDQIINPEVADLLSNLHNVKDIVEDLHVKYTVTRVHKEGDEENKLEQEDELYATILDKTYRDAIRVYYDYSVQLEAQKKTKEKREALKSKCAEYSEKLISFKAKITEYDLAYSEAMAIVESEDEFALRTAPLQKSMLCMEYDKLLIMGQELLTFVPHIEGVDESDKELFYCNKEKLNHRKMLTLLEKIIRKIEFEDKEKFARLSPVPLVNTDDPTLASVGCARGSKLLKLKVSAPKFSGKSRDFAVFKRDFNSIVAVDHRSAVEIGALLKESIPSDYKYLLDKFELSQHDKMMECLTEKFGRARIIVDECTAELKCMDKITSDSQFIEFVNHLDKVKCDLSQLGLLAEIANTTVISEIESKLPSMVQRDWIKLASSKEISEKPSSEIFQKLLDFLEDNKRQAEYFGTDVRQPSPNLVKSPTKNSFVSCGAAGSLDSSMTGYKAMLEEIRDPLQCLACGDSSAPHPTNSCEVWRSFTYQQKREKVRCIYHPAKGLKCNHTTEECKVGKAKCYICNDSNRNGHHTWFCQVTTNPEHL